MHQSDPPTPPDEINPKYNPATQDVNDSPVDEFDDLAIEDVEPAYNPVTSEFVQDDEADDT